MNKNELHKKLIEIAAQSPCQKRKVGAAIVMAHSSINCPLTYTILADGYNFNPDGGACELANGETNPLVKHAEVVAIEDWKYKQKHFQSPAGPSSAITMFVTHQPCDSCLAQMKAAGIEHYEVIGDFMKFDGSKTRYDLVPPSSVRALADVLTYGARKYKPDNWRKVDEPAKYIAAAMRHFEAYRQGEEFDVESGLPHLAHAMTNIAFLLELEYVPELGGTNGKV